MSKIVYQGLQSCLEPQVKETATMRLKLDAPKLLLGNKTSLMLHNGNTKEKCLNDNTSNLDDDLGGWSFLQNLSNSSNTNVDSSTYVHPYKATSCPSLRLSDKSLELCTENLGSETGSDDTNEINIFSFNESPKCEQKISQQFSSKKKAKSLSFPPPLTSLSGANAIQVSPRREDRRLIIEAVEAPTMRTCFEVERSNGRLKLRFLHNCEFNYEHGNVSRLEEGIQENDDDENDEIINPYDEKNEEEFGEVEGNGGDMIMEKDMDGNSLDVEVEMGMEKFQRPSTCKEGGNGASDNGRLRSWEALWVAT